MTRPSSTDAALRHLRLRLSSDLREAVRRLARSRRTSMSGVIRALLEREVGNDSAATGSRPDESAIREMAILIAVELGLKLQELSLPGGATRSRELLEAAARTAMERLDMVEASLERGGRQ